MANLAETGCVARESEIAHVCISKSKNNPIRTSRRIACVWSDRDEQQEQAG
jgi:hypothetical protein